VTVYYLLACLDCDDEDPLVMPFATAEARGSWAAAHTKATGHARWRVEDERRNP
jgi:hypothetical protein